MPINKSEDFDKEKDIDERKPKPYRYLKNTELNEEDSINFDCDNTFTIMKTDKSKMKFDFDNPAIFSNNKIIGKVEKIIKKHEEIKKFKDF